MLDFLKMIRVKEYVKNIIVFAPIFFSAKLLDYNLISNTLLSFISFSLIASSVYILNDLIDLKSDKQHPLKKNRPIAAEKISKASAIFVMLLFAITSIGISYTVNALLLYVILAYGGINILYSLWLKHISLVDIFVISFGFVLRLLAGSAATGIVLSDWIVLLTVLLAVFLVLGKRRQDVVLYTETNLVLRKSISGYNIKFIDFTMILIASVIISIYIMYCISSDIVFANYGQYFKLTSLWIIIAFLRYFQLIFVFEKSKSPLYLFFEDGFLISIVVLWVSTIAFFIYF